MKYVFLILGVFGTIINIILIVKHLVEKFILKTNRFTNNMDLFYVLSILTINLFFVIHFALTSFQSNFIYPCLCFGEVNYKLFCLYSNYAYFASLFASVLVYLFFPIKYQQIKTNNNQTSLYKEATWFFTIIILFGPLAVFIAGIGYLFANRLSPPWYILSFDRKLWYVYRYFILNFIYILIFFKSRKISLKITDSITAIKKIPLNFIYSDNNIEQLQRKRLYNLSNILIFFYVVYLAGTFIIKYFHPDYFAGDEYNLIRELGRNSFYFILVYFGTIFFVSYKNEKKIYFEKVYFYSLVLLIFFPIFIIPSLFKLYINIKKITINNENTIITSFIIVLFTAIITNCLNYLFKIKKSNKKNNNIKLR